MEEKNEEMIGSSAGKKSTSTRKTASNKSTTETKTTRKPRTTTSAKKKPVKEGEMLLGSEPKEIAASETTEEVVALEEKNEIKEVEHVEETVSEPVVSDKVTVEEVTEEEAEKVKKGLGAQPTKIAPAVEVKLEYDLTEEEAHESIEELVESKRAPMYKFLLNSKIVSYLIMGASFLIMIFLLITVLVKTPENLNDLFQVLQFVGIGLVIILLGANFIYSHFITKKQKKRVNEYLTDISKLIYSHCYGVGVGVENPKLSPNGKIDVQDVINAHLYTVINRVESRALVTGTVNGVELRTADVAVIVPTSITALSGIKPSSSRAQEAYAIYGRYFAYDKKLSAGNAFIICRRENNCVLPDHLQHYQTVDVETLNSSFVVYATSEELVKNKLNSEVIDLLNTFANELPLLNYIISYNENGLYVATTYNDDYMAYPINKPVVSNIYQSVKTQSEQIVRILKSLK